jgi:hypothetical protein
MVKLALLLFAWWLGNLFVGDSPAAEEPGTPRPSPSRRRKVSPQGPRR